MRLAGNALLSSLDMAALIIGPLLAGLPVAVADPALAIAADAATFGVLAAAARSTTRSIPRGEPGLAQEATRSNRTRGFQIILRNRALAGLLALTWMFFLLYGPVDVALPLHVVDTLGGVAAYWVCSGQSSG